MNTVLWVLQVLLAVAFLLHGLLYLVPPPEMMELLKPIPTALRLLIGAAEVLAAIGLTVPGLTRTLTALVPAAAGGLMVVMISATVFHVSRSEWSSAMTTTILLVLLTFVAYMRWKVMPIRPRAVA
jgi:uncharacterized membrane protein YphA (DoxX/SURF4 family)